MKNVFTAKLFKNGNSQAVRLPKEFRFEGTEVLIYREGGHVVLQPKQSDWESFFFNTPPASSDFMRERNDTPPQPREIF
jgi:antitoxin VapB